MIVDSSFMFTKVGNIAKWPFQNENNFNASALTTIAFLVSQRLFNVSYFFSLVFAATIFSSTRIYQYFQMSDYEEKKLNHSVEKKTEEKKQENIIRLTEKDTFFIQVFKCYRIIVGSYKTQKNHLKKEERENKIKEMQFFLIRDLLYIKDLLRGYQLNENKEKINQDECVRQKEKFIELCKYFNLDLITFLNTWVSWPAVHKDEYLLHCKNRAEYFFNKIYSVDIS